VPPDDELLLPQQAAAALGVDVRTLLRWAKADMLPTVRTPGGYRRYRAGDVEAFRTRLGLDQRDQLLTVADVVERYGITYGAFRWMYRTGRVPYVRTPGGQRRFRLEDIHAALSSR
jgi:excisionase family DNA binding protein